MRFALCPGRTKLDALQKHFFIQDGSGRHLGRSRHQFWSASVFWAGVLFCDKRNNGLKVYSLIRRLMRFDRRSVGRLLKTFFVWKTKIIKSLWKSNALMWWILHPFQRVQGLDCIWLDGATKWNLLCWIKWHTDQDSKLASSAFPWSL